MSELSPVTSTSDLAIVPSATTASWFGRYRNRISDIAIGLMGGVVFITLWLAATAPFDVPAYILPPPGRVFRALMSGILVAPTDPLGFYRPLWDTLFATFSGFFIGAIIAILVGALMAEFRLLRQAAMPYVFALQSLPKVAVAPLIIAWFGFGIGAKITMAAMMAFFPVVVNVYAGIRSVEPELVDLMRTLNASRRDAYRYVMIPGSAQFLFAGLNLGLVYALLGTILIEFLSAVSGMGVVITKAESVTDTATVFAALVVLAATGILLNAGAKALQKRIVHWSGREQ
jgi:NitT/TauT family transport system permease protein